MMQWFHLTLLTDSAIVNDLRANASTPDQRLKLIGNKVNIPAHNKSYNFFQLADMISLIMFPLEAGYFNDFSSYLYAPSIGDPQEYKEAMEIIITQWSKATGRDMKAKAKGLRR
jgi:hypothetical protein